MAPRSRGRASGISIIEVMLALTILSVVLMALGALMFQVGRHTRNSATVSYRGAAQQGAAAWAQALPWDSIPGAIGCATDTTGQMVYTRCVTVQTVSSNLLTVSTVITPSGALTARPDTVVVERNKPRSTSPLKVR